jgi:hypothetical protein
MAVYARFRYWSLSRTKSIRFTPIQYKLPWLFRWLNCKKVQFWGITLLSVHSSHSTIKLQDLGVTPRGVFQERNLYELHTCQKIVVSIPDGVTGILRWFNPSDRSITLGPIQEYLLEVKAAGVRVDNLTTFMCQLSENLGASNSWNTQGLSRSIQRSRYLYFNDCGCTETVPSLNKRTLFVTICSTVGHNF